MTAELDNLYLRWLYSLISPMTIKNPARTYWSFAKQLYTKEFVWFIPNDDNRLADGIALRAEFFSDYDITDVDEIWHGLGCSMLEMFVGLSRRLAFLLDCSAQEAFWKLIENLGSIDCSDRAYEERPEIAIEIDRILDTIIWRTYAYDGVGGLFPLRNPQQDQTKVEIWYQMGYWVMEREDGVWTSIA